MRPRPTAPVYSDRPVAFRGPESLGGQLLWLPARTHRFLGSVALLVSAVVTAAVVVPLADVDWEVGAFGPGFWCAIAVAVLGLLGSLKALLTGPRY
ncbi:hypothetical protein [Blastococcus capsensis]|uniref:hypothetical protein n=1 Tax=Blastococcus capsensis TaxID=1564163 RepID=UPI002540E0D7|nr:hypothetical protein [Blastococcus capsensis]MDK3256212.1 hypothetical protein [Blastococcus capsensis]